MDTPVEKFDVGVGNSIWIGRHVKLILDKDGNKIIPCAAVLDGGVGLEKRGTEIVSFRPIDQGPYAIRIKAPAVDWIAMEGPVRWDIQVEKTLGFQDAQNFEEQDPKH